MQPLELAAVRWAAGWQPPEELPELATQALTRGLDTPALRQLAGLSNPTRWDVKDLFEQTLRELGIVQPDEQAALWQMARHTAQEMVDGVMPAIDGAVFLAGPVTARLEQEGKLRCFIALVDDWQETADRRCVTGRIIEEARDLVARVEPRRWLRIQVGIDRPPVMESGSVAETDLTTIPITDALRAEIAAWAALY